MRENIVKAAREAASAARSRSAWNYDHIECVANEAAAASWDAFADALEAQSA